MGWILWALDGILRAVRRLLKGEYGLSRPWEGTNDVRGLTYFPNSGHIFLQKKGRQNGNHPPSGLPSHDRGNRVLARKVFSVLEMRVRALFLDQPLHLLYNSASKITFLKKDFVCQREGVQARRAAG